MNELYLAGQYRSNRWYYDGGSQFDLERFARALAPAEQIKRHVRHTKEPLWEGFFGMFDGPQIVPTGYHSRRLDNGVVEATKEWTRSFGRRHDGSAGVSVRGGDVMTTGALAYVAKLTEGRNASPFVPHIVLYKGNMNTDITSQVRGPGIVETIKDVGGFSVRIASQPDSYDNQTAPETTEYTTPMFVTNAILRVSVPSRLGSLPSAVAAQHEVFKGFITPDVSAQVYRLFGAKDGEHLNEAWSAAMAERTPGAAAVRAMSELS